MTTPAKPPTYTIGNFTTEDRAQLAAKVTERMALPGTPEKVQKIGMMLYSVLLDADRTHDQVCRYAKDLAREATETLELSKTLGLLRGSTGQNISQIAQSYNEEQARLLGYRSEILTLIRVLTILEEG